MGGVLGEGGWVLMLRCASGCLVGTGAGCLILWDYREGCKLSSHGWPWREAVQEKWRSICPVSPWLKVCSNSGPALLDQARVGTGQVSRRGSSSPGVGGSEGAGGARVPASRLCRAGCCSGGWNKNLEQPGGLGVHRKCLVPLQTHTCSSGNNYTNLVD